MAKVTAQTFANSYRGISSPGFFSGSTTRDPSAQPANFDSAGVERLDARGRVSNFDRFGNPPAFKTLVTLKANNVPSGGTGASPVGSTAGVETGTGGALSNGAAKVSVNAFSATSSKAPITGRLNATGSAASETEEIGYVSSFNRVDVRGGRGLLTGTITWNPVLSAPVQGGEVTVGKINQRVLTDPVFVQVVDPATEAVLAESTLLSIGARFLGDGTLDWDSESNAANNFSIDAMGGDADFHVAIESPILPAGQRGTLDLKIRAGVVTAASDSGIYDGLLPAVGSPGAFSRRLNPINLNYDLGNFGGRNVDVSVGFAGGGVATSYETGDEFAEPVFFVPVIENPPSAVPGPTAWQFAGIAGLFIAGRQLSAWLRRRRTACAPQCNGNRPEEIDMRGAILKRATFSMGAAAILIGVSAPLARAGKVSYSTAHNFSLTPGGTVTPTVTGQTFANSYADIGVIDGSISDPHTDPSAQPANFDKFGVEKLDTRGKVANFSRLVNPGTLRTIANLKPRSISSAGTGPVGSSIQSSVLVDAQPTKSNGAGLVSVNPFTSFNSRSAISGSLKATGTADDPNGQLAYVSSFNRVDIKGGRKLLTGTITWNPILSAPNEGGNATAGKINQRSMTDPIFLQVFDPVTSAVLAESTLLSIESNFLGNGILDWDSESNAANNFSIDAMGGDADFHILIESPLVPVAQRGTLDLQIRGGVITGSSDSGRYDGLLPPVGQNGAFSRRLNPINLNYDLGDFGGRDVTVAVGFAGGGVATAYNTGGDGTFFDPQLPAVTENPLAGGGPRAVPGPDAWQFATIAGVFAGVHQISMLRRRRRERTA